MISMESNVKGTRQRNGASGLAGFAVIAIAWLATGCTRSGDILTSDAGAAPGGLCLGPTCLPDPGWGPVDCTEQDGVDTLSIDNFDGTLTNSNGTFVAQDFYVYSDGTSPPTFENYAHQPVADAGGFQPPTTPLYLCGPDAGSDPRTGIRNRVLHLFGGPFLGWGGGTGIAMAKLNGRDMGGRDNATMGGDPAQPAPSGLRRSRGARPCGARSPSPGREPRLPAGTASLYAVAKHPRRSSPSTTAAPGEPISRMHPIRSI